MKAMPNFKEVYRILTGNEVYNKISGIEVRLKTKIDDHKGTFEISLFAEKKEKEFSILLETRIAIEQHQEGEGHYQPHIQIENKGIQEELAKKGRLHIILLVKDDIELTRCCNGFLFMLSEILEDIEEKIGEKLGLNEFFFYMNLLNKLNCDKTVLQEYIYSSFKHHQVKYYDEQDRLVKYKGKKSEPEIDFINPYEGLKILLRLGFLNRLTLELLIKLILENGKIKKTCPVLTIEECKIKLLEIELKELKHFNEAQFIKMFSD